MAVALGTGDSAKCVPEKLPSVRTSTGPRRGWGIWGVELDPRARVPVWKITWASQLNSSTRQLSSQLVNHKLARRGLEVEGALTPVWETRLSCRGDGCTASVFS